MTFGVLPQPKYEEVVGDQASNVPNKIRRLYMGGSLCRGFLMAPNDFNYALNYMSDMLTKVYDKKLDITAVRQEWSEDDTHNYATIYGRSGSAIFLSIFLDDREQSLVVPNKKPGNYTRFSFHFPTKRLEQQTKEAVPKIWDLVEGIEFRKADAKLGISSGDGNIILSDPPLRSNTAVPERRIIASGYPALERLKIDVEKRPVFLVDTTG